MEFYNLVDEHDWDGLKALILAGHREDMSKYSYKDYPLIFDVIHAKDPGASDMACFWLDHGYPHSVTGGRMFRTLAHAAACAGLPDVIRKLAELGADINQDDSDGNTPLWEAARYGNAHCVKALLEAGADPDGFEERPGRDFRPQAETPLAVAATPEIASLLLEAGADPTIGMDAGYLIDDELERHLHDEIISPLSHACLDGREATASFLLAMGADPRGSDGQAMRCLAISKMPSTGLLDALIRAGADVNGSSGREPLRLAALTGNGQLCEALLKAGAEPVPDALPLAAGSGSLPCVEILLKRKVGKLTDAIFMAAKMGQREILDRLLEVCPDKGPGAALHGAIAGCRFELAYELMDMGADPDARDDAGMTPLIRLFSLDRRIELWRRMITAPDKYRPERQCGPEYWRPKLWELDDPEQARSGRNRPANWNEMTDQFEEEAQALALRLLELGADIHARDRMDRSVLWYACSKYWLKTIPRLLDLGLDLGARDKDGISAFEAGCLSHESYTIKPMLSRGYDPNARDRNGDTALLKTARDGKESARYSSAIFHLLINGADPDLKNKKGVSFRMMAEKNEELALTLEWAEGA